MHPDDQVREWLQWMSHERRYSPCTVKRYRTALQRFTRHAANTNGALDTAGLRLFIRDLSKAGRSNSTIRTYAAGVAAFCTWANRYGHRTDNPATGLQLPPAEDTRRPLVTRQQLQKLFRAAPLLPHPWTPELARAILATLSGCGLRNAEARALNDDDVDLQRRVLLVQHGKGGKRAELPIPASQIHYHEAWRERREQLFRDHPATRKHAASYLLTEPAGPLGRGALCTLFDHLKAIAGLGSARFSPHSLRHYAITLWAEKGNLRDAQLLARHASIKTTARYCHPTNPRLRSIADAAADELWDEPELHTTHRKEIPCLPSASRS